MLFAHGADLFDASCWWEAHEVWELIWRDLPPGPDREALQGMIQAAAHLLRREDPRTRAAAERLKQRAIGRLQVWLDVHGPSYRGVDLQALRDALLGPSHAPPRLLALRNDPASEVP